MFSHPLPGYCEAEPVVIMAPEYPKAARYTQGDGQDMDEMMGQYFLTGQVVNRLLPEDDL